MIYLDTSVALAHLLAEDRRPPETLWSETLVSSRLLEFELWTRVRSEDRLAVNPALVQTLLSHVAILELIPEVTALAQQPFPLAVRTLDALHLASLLFLREQGANLALASYDQRMLDVARAMGIPIYPLP